MTNPVFNINLLKKDCELSMPLVTRFEVIDDTGRAMVKYGVKLYAQLQDDGRTLKVFVKQNNGE